MTSRQFFPVLTAFFVIPLTTHGLTIAADPAVAEIKTKNLFRSEARITIVNPEETTLRYEAKAPEGTDISPASFTLTPHETQTLRITGYPKTDDGLIKISAREGDAPGFPVQAELQIPIQSQAVSALVSGVIPALIGALLVILLTVIFRKYFSANQTLKRTA